MKKYRIKLDIHLKEWYLLPFIVTGTYETIDHKTIDWRLSFLCFSLYKAILIKINESKKNY